MGHMEAAIAELQKKLEEAEAQVATLKGAINTLLKVDGKDPLYEDVPKAGAITIAKVKRDQFFGQKLITALREILEMRKAAGDGPTNVNELYATLLDGGYQFGTTDEENAKRGLRISLTKNAHTFLRIPGGGGMWGLSKWYPNVKPPKVAPDAEEKSADADAQDQETDATNP